MLCLRLLLAVFMCVAQLTAKNFISPHELSTLARAFHVFTGRALPVTSRGQDRTHVLLRFDHRRRVDIGVAPFSSDGLWIQDYLQKLKIPYLTFRAAIAGIATGPHIHVGLPSHRLAKRVRRSHRKRR